MTDMMLWLCCQFLYLLISAKFDNIRLFLAFYHALNVIMIRHESTPFRLDSKRDRAAQDPHIRVPRLPDRRGQSSSKVDEATGAIRRCRSQHSAGGERGREREGERREGGRERERETMKEMVAMIQGRKRRCAARQVCFIFVTAAGQSITGVSVYSNLNIAGILIESYRIEWVYA